MQELLTQAKQDFARALEHFEQDLQGLRTGRAHSGLLSSVEVESYGQRVPLQHVANVTVSDPKTLTITPWDKSQMSAVEKGILAANLGLTPSNDGTNLRVSVPAMTEERRKELVKVVGQMAEKARINVRGCREEILKQVKRQEQEGGVSQDEVKRFSEQLQKLVEEINGQIKDLAERKEAEVMTV